MKLMIVPPGSLSIRGKRALDRHPPRTDEGWPVKVEEAYRKHKRSFPVLDIPRGGALVLEGATRRDWNTVRRLAETVGKRTGMEFSTLWHDEFQAVEVVRKW